MSGSDKSEKMWVESENVYWTQFQSARFGVLLSGDFTSQLLIPKKFTENVKKRLPEKVTVRGPAGGNQNWEVQLNTNNNTTSFVGESWKDFITTYGLKENDFLVFKYKYNSYFKVIILDAESCWVEKESSYFVIKSDAPRTNHDEKDKQEKVAELREETSPQVSNDINEESEQVLKRVSDSRERVPVMSKEVAEDDSDEEVEVIKRKNDDPEWTPAKKSREEHGDIRDTPESIRTTTGGKALDWPRDVLKSPRGSSSKYSSRKQKFPRRKSPSASYYYLTQKHGISGRNWEPTDREKERAKQLAHQELTDEGFSIIMSPSHVGKQFRVAIPKGWTNKYMSGCNQDVVLRLKEQVNKKWRIRYNFDRTRGTGQFVGGWNQFVLDNAVHESDVCVFKLAGRKDGNVCMDVKIIRVIEDGGNHLLEIDRVNGQGQEKHPTGGVVVGLKSMTSSL